MILAAASTGVCSTRSRITATAVCARTSYLSSCGTQSCIWPPNQPCLGKNWAIQCPTTASPECTSSRSPFVLEVCPCQIPCKRQACPPQAGGFKRWSSRALAHHESLDESTRKTHSSHPLHLFLSSQWSSFTFHCSLQHSRTVPRCLCLLLRARLPGPLVVLVTVVTMTLAPSWRTGAGACPRMSPCSHPGARSGQPERQAGFLGGAQYPTPGRESPWGTLRPQPARRSRTRTEQAPFLRKWCLHIQISKFFQTNETGESRNFKKCFSRAPNLVLSNLTF